MARIPDDRFRFRRVIINILMLPCGVAWMYVLLFYFSSIAVVVAISIVLGVGTAFLLGYSLHFICHTIITKVDKHLGQQNLK